MAQVVGTINFIRNENMWYSACTRDFGGRTCNKKLTENSPGQYYCERCQAACTEPAWRYLLSLQAQDHTAAQWLTAFGDTGNDILGGTSAEELKNHVDSQGFEQMINENNFRTFLFKLKVLQDNYGDENRVKVRGGAWCVEYAAMNKSDDVSVKHCSRQLFTAGLCIVLCSIMCPQLCMLPATACARMLPCRLYG